MRGVVADTVTGSFWMPDASIRKVNAVVLGATNFARVGKREVLDWPPQTIFAEFNQEFLRSELALGYAKPLNPQWLFSQSAFTARSTRTKLCLGVATATAQGHRPQSRTLVSA
jgi:hypothetical protein